MKPSPWVVALVSLLLLLAACTGESGTSTPTAAPEPPPQPATTIAEPTATVAEPTVTVVEESGLLPAPLYYLAGEENRLQIWRLERDGESASQLTEEPEGVTDFDVSPVDNALAYVSGDALIRADASGENRTVLHRRSDSGDPASQFGDHSLSAPRWSPDGSQIAFGLHGLNVIAAEGGEPQLLLTSDPAPEPPNFPEGPLRFYRPEAWSPDGDQLLTMMNFFPEGGTLIAVNLADNQVIEFENSSGLSCCNPSWSPDGGSVYFANPVPVMLPGGLWRADTQTGAVEALLSMTFESVDPGAQASHPHASADGYLYALKGEPGPASTNPEEMFTPDLVLQRVAVEQASDLAAWEVLNAEAVHPIEARWASDLSGVVFSQDEGQGWLPQGNPLYWLSAAGEPIVALPVQGRMMRWGR